MSSFYIQLFSFFIISFTCPRCSSRHPYHYISYDPLLYIHEFPWLNIAIIYMYTYSILFSWPSITQRSTGLFMISILSRLCSFFHFMKIIYYPPSTIFFIIYYSCLTCPRCSSRQNPLYLHYAFIIFSITSLPLVFYYISSFLGAIVLSKISIFF